MPNQINEAKLVVEQLLLLLQVDLQLSQFFSRTEKMVISGILIEIAKLVESEAIQRKTDTEPYHKFHMFHTRTGTMK